MKNGCTAGSNKVLIPWQLSEQTSNKQKIKKFKVARFFIIKYF